MYFKTILLSLAAISLLCSCDENRIFEKHNTNFPQFRWQKGQEVSFKPTVADTAANYRITLAMRHVNGFQFNELKLSLSITSPSGNEQELNYTIPVMDSKGTYYSECALDHPLGMRGTRIAWSAALELQLTGKKYTLATMCIGMGQGYAVALEKV